MQLKTRQAWYKNWPSIILVFTMICLAVAYFCFLGSAVQPPLDTDNVLNMHPGGFDKLAEFDVPVSVSDTPTKYKAILKVFGLSLLVSIQDRYFYPQSSKRVLNCLPSSL